MTRKSSGLTELSRALLCSCTPGPDWLAWRRWVPCLPAPKTPHRKKPKESLETVSCWIVDQLKLEPLDLVWGIAEGQLEMQSCDVPRSCGPTTGSWCLLSAGVSG